MRNPKQFFTKQVYTTQGVYSPDPLSEDEFHFVLIGRFSAAICEKYLRCMHNNDRLTVKEVGIYRGIYQIGYDDFFRDAETLFETEIDERND